MATKKVSGAVVSEDEDKLSACTHHWMIAKATGPVSIGICDICSESKEFGNSVFAIEELSKNARSEKSKSPKSTREDLVEDEGEC